MRAATQSLIRFNFSLLCAVSAQTRPHQHLLTRTAAHAEDRRMARSYPKPLNYVAKAKQTASVIIIHGLGDSGHGWADFGPELGAGGPSAAQCLSLPSKPCRGKEVWRMNLCG